MSTKRTMSNAPEGDLFKDLTESEKMEADIRAEVAMAIRNKRDALGLTQKQFAERLGVSQTTVSKWESCSCNYTLKKLMEILPKLGMKLGVIENRTEAHNPTRCRAGSQEYTIGETERTKYYLAH